MQNVNFSNPYGHNLSPNFTNRFYDLCIGIPAIDKIEVVGLLQELDQAGFVIDEQKIVHGTKAGTSWPCLYHPSKGNIQIGLAIGSRGSQGLGDTTLVNYLLMKKREASADMTPLMSNFVSDLLESKGTTPIQLSFGGTAQPNPSNGRISTQLAAILGISNVNIVTSSSESLETIRSFGAFLGEPGKAAVTPFTVDQLLGATLAVLSEGKCIVYKKGNVLASSKGVELLNQSSIPGFYFDNGIYVDRPCKESPKLSTQLNDREKLVELLPYINGLSKNYGYIKI